MRAAALGLLIALAAGLAARAEPAYEAGSAMGACLAAVIDRAPVVSVKGHDVEIRREANPNACTVEATAGIPSEVRDSVLAAIAKRPERFAPALTHWDPVGYASRETFCNAPGRRNLNVVVSIAKPGAKGPTLLATVVEAKDRDERCDRDAGLQRPPLG
ncbi:MAG: hypothetical protein JWQ46_980 [Phenylobacterium sp.]|nr:hypothetical protein [Phenylobacterium sp.]